MGEAPVAIVKTLLALDQVSNLKAALRDLVVAKLGTSFALAGVYTLADLGIDDFPILASGKVHKKDLKARVMEHLSQLQLEKSQASRAYPMLSQVKDVWAQLLGRLPENVESSMSATEVADSLTIMRFCYDVEKQTGKRLSITEVLENPTVDLQARLLREKDRNRVGDNVPKARQSSGPPSTKDMVFTNGDSLKVAQTARCAHSPLKALHLTWHEDVEDAYQNTDAMRSHWSNRQRPASFNIRWAMRVKRANVARVRWALEQALSRHATLRSIIIYLEDGTPIHLVIRPSKQWYDRCIEQGGPVPTAEQVCRLLGRMDLGFGGPPAPLFRGYMMPIESSGEIGLILSINHPAYDAFSLGMFFEDLDLLLQDDTPVLEDRVPFKLFADTYYLHQGGAAARASIDLQVKRLKGISKLSQALWPVAQGPEWLHGNDTGWTRQDGRPGHPGSRLSFDKEENRPEGRSIWRKDTIPSLAKLKGDRSIEASTLVKAAIALYNTEVTGHPHAIFCNLEAGRAWPFLESWIADSLPNPMKIAGPTLVCSINAIAVEDAAECVGALLSRMQRDQARLSEHAHAPFSVVKRELGELDGAVMDDVGRRQVYNWDPSRSARRHRHHDTTTTTTTTSARTSTFNNKGPISSSLELLGRQGWPDYGFFWNFGLEDEETLVGFVMYDDAHLRHAEAKAALDRVVAIVAWMAEPGNWTAGIGRLGELK